MKLVNLWANAGAGVLYDGADANLALTNIGAGQGLTVQNSGGNEALLISQVSLQGATIAPLRVVASTVSQAVLSVSGVFLSTASINLAANKTAFIIPVYHQSQNVWGFIAASQGVV